MVKLFFSRFHVTTAKSLTDKVSFILTGLRNEAMITVRGHQYKFFNCYVDNIDGIDYIIGELVKYKPKETEEVVDDKSMTIVNEDILNKVVIRIKFIIDTTSSIIMHKSFPSLLSITSFRKVFSSLFEINHDKFFTEIFISPIKEQYSFIEKIKSFKSIKRISITLVPSNPNYGDRWKDIDNRLNLLGIDTYKETQEAKKENSSIRIDDDTENKLLMSEDGYGKCNAFGIIETGEEKKISTSDNQKDIFIYLPNDIQENNEIISSAKLKLYEIVSRTSK